MPLGGCPSVVGDINGDGEVDAWDIEPFLVALLEPNQYPTRQPHCDIRLADINSAGAIDPFNTSRRCWSCSSNRRHTLIGGWERVY